MLTCIILTFNESKHLRRCIESLQPVCSRIVVIDSYSTDDTCEITRSLSAEFLQNKWTNNYAAQLNWGIEHANVQTPWTLRMDADEYLTPELQREILEKLPSLGPNVGGIILPRRVVFKGKTIHHGGFYPQWLLRIWRTGTGHCEERMMDEHMVVSSGSVVKFRHDLVDENLNDIHWWTIKHNNYARREAADLLNIEFGLFRKDDFGDGEGNVQANRKRWIKENIYSKLPLGVRPAIYFLYRFVGLCGFLDHPRVWIFHFLQGFWYRLLVDINVWEFKKEVGNENLQAKGDYLRKKWGISMLTNNQSTQESTFLLP
jgi:glycosyltransferase involved in cell wall biosynthesis